MTHRALQLLTLLSMIAAWTATTALAFDNACNDNLVTYWGQNSYGAAYPNDRDGWQKPLRFYCDEGATDMFPIAFLTNFFSKGGKPTINLADECNRYDNATFPGTDLANCTAGIQDDIKYCQSKGKALTLSLGGATAGAGFQSDEQAIGFADTLWNDLLGGSSNTRPFGNAILDGIDLDIENGGAAHYPAFLQKLKSYFDAADKKYYVTAAPQCVYPDANLQTTLDQFPVDAVYVQFYNNPCGLQTYGQARNWNFGMWDYWARHVSPNPDVKVYIGAPASSTAAGSGYVSLDTLQKITTETRSSFPSFGGVMFWDTSQAYGNNRLDQNIKDILKEGASCDPSAFAYPPCDAPAWSDSGRTYTTGNRVSHKGYIWEAKWSAGSEPTANPMGEWAPVSACEDNNSIAAAVNSDHGPPSSSANGSSSSSRSSGKASSTPALETITIKSPPPPTATNQVPTAAIVVTTTVFQNVNPVGGDASNTIPHQDKNCDSIEPWSQSKTYVGGSKAIHQGQVWTAKWWSYGDVPSGPAGVWSPSGSC
ncbi:class III chitinase [Zychaea mexicana]|uniref:class III chitinase n=1 Tax=Zychaea mexicana TaxID=64656 RepID=UPI0022FF1746|nr:class III chitinase [Zychaea mexicana]KAI9495608.1 class III chitinase [Zychaea mexicana]